MQTSLSSVSSRTPSALRLKFERYVIEPIDRVGFFALWICATIGMVSGTLYFLLLIFEQVMPKFSHLWAISFPTSLAEFSATPIGLLLCSIVFYCWANIYIVKQTKQAYQEFRVWAVSIYISWPGRNGVWRTFTLRHLSVVWSNTWTVIPVLRILFTALFQSMALLWQRAYQQSVSSSGVLSVIDDGKTTAAVMTMLTEESDAPSDEYTSSREGASVTSGMFGTILRVCQIRIVGPSGAAKVIEVQHRPYLLLWLYLVVLSITGQWVNVNDILRDVYGYNESLGGEGTKDGKDERKKLLDRFHNHHHVLRDEINAARIEVGLPQTDILQKEHRNKCFFWRLANSIEIQDLALLEQCRTLLTASEEMQEEERPLHSQVITTCEQFSMVVGDMEAIKPYHETPGLQKLLRETLMTYTKALKYLAHTHHIEAQETTNAKEKRMFARKEEQYWATYALSCASFADELPGQYERLNQQGEAAIRKAFSCCLDLHDRDLADALYQDYRQTKERDNDSWEPETKTKQLWHKVLAMNEEDVA